MTEQTRTFLPAAGKDWLLPFYDPVVKLLGGDAARKILMDEADLRTGQRVLEVGCGTGTLVLMMKRAHIGIEVVGIDPDPKALARARIKTAQAGVTGQFDQGFADGLPYRDGSFDRVLSSFMFHHLPTAEKGKFLAQVNRVLKTGVHSTCWTSKRRVACTAGSRICFIRATNWKTTRRIGCSS